MDYVKRIYDALMAVQEKHFEFFLKEQKMLTDYIELDWNYPTSITYYNEPSLPVEIRTELEQILK
jgi:hypothetical protein